MLRPSVPDLLAENEELREWANKERKLADDLADVLANRSEHQQQVRRVLARYREARR